MFKYYQDVECIKRFSKMKISMRYNCLLFLVLLQLNFGLIHDSIAQNSAKELKEKARIARGKLYSIPDEAMSEIKQILQESKDLTYDSLTIYCSIILGQGYTQWGQPQKAITVWGFCEVLPESELLKCT